MPTIHLKRFEICSFSQRKVNRRVQLGERPDLAPFRSSIGQGPLQLRLGQRRVLFSLFGVAECSGRLSNGHYTTHVRVRRHDRLRVSPAMVTPFVSDVFKVACGWRGGAPNTLESAEQTVTQVTRTAESSQADGRG